MSLEEAKQKHIETGGRLCELVKEQRALPGQIQAAANASDSETLNKLAARKVAIEAEVAAATVADREAQIAVFEAELAEASARATELSNRLPSELYRLKEEREDLHARLEQNGRDSARVVHEEAKARGVVDELRAKIAGAQQALSLYVKESAERAAA